MSQTATSTTFSNIAEKSHCLSKRAIGITMVVSIAFVAFMTYREILGYFFTGQDTLTLIETSRIQSSDDIVRVLTEPLMNRTRFLEAGQFFRPLTNFSYSLDYAIWKLNPLGYHLTSLLLHVATSLLVFFLIKSLANNDRFTAWLGAILFTIHPVLFESVPEAGKPELLMSFFMLLSLLAFFKLESLKFHSIGYWALSLTCYILAFAAKEPGIILPCLIVAYLVVCASSETSLIVRITRALKTALPYFILTILMLGWRLYVLQGMGGYGNKSLATSSAAEILLRSAKTARLYFEDLFYPVDFLRPPFDYVTNGFDQALSLGALACFYIGFYWYRRTRTGGKNQQTGRMLKFWQILIATVIFGSLAGILAYPLMASTINQVILRAYDGSGMQFLASRLRGRQELPVEVYYSLVNVALFQFCFFTLLLMTVCFLIATGWKSIKTFLGCSAHGKAVTLLLIWLSLPLAIYLVTLGFAHRYIYTSVIPFTAILSIILVSLFRTLASQPRRSGRWNLASVKNPALIGFAIITGLALSFVTYSPALRPYGEWKESGRLAATFLSKLSGVISTLPDTAMIEIADLPEHISSYEFIVPHSKSPSYLGRNGIQSWLDMNYPEKHLQVEVRSTTVLAVPPANLFLETRMVGSGHVAVTVRASGLTEEELVQGAISREIPTLEQ